MEKNGGGASWEQVHRILFPGGPVPPSLINPNQANGPHLAAIPGAGILGPHPAASGGASPPPGAPPGFGLQQNASNFPPLAPPQPGGHIPPTNPMLLNAPAAQVKDGGSNSHFGLPPPAPMDLKLLHYIKLFAAFVAKFGPENEALVRAKHQGRPEFSFLFGGEPGSEASIGNTFYEWQKDVIIRVLEAMKGLAEGKIPPESIKSMRRELEQSINGGAPLKDLRLEAILGFPEGKLDWQKIAWELGVTLPGDKRSLEPSEKPEKNIKPAMIRLNGDVVVPHELPTRESRVLKPEKPRDLHEEFSPGSRRRRNRSRSRSPDRARHRYKSRSPPRRSPRRSRTPPLRRNRRSYSRSPPRRRLSPPPRRAANDRKRELEDEHVMPLPYGAPQFHHPVTPMVHERPGFLGGDNNSFGRFMPPPPPLPVLESGLPSSAPLQSPPMSQDSGLLRSFPQVGAQAPPFQAPPPLSEIPVQQQQFLLQHLQFPQMMVAPPPVNPNIAFGNGDAQFVPQMLAPVFTNQQQQLNHPQQQQQQQMNHREKLDPRRRAPSPPNDLEMEMEKANGEASGKGGEDDEAKKSTRDSEESGRGSDKEKDSRALKIVRNTVAEFVKELLTPKWKDGVLSKDDFKVIAQKAVNKVVGNLQGSQIPKGSERVDRFMTSSREKITKLVQEYVDKHTKNAPATTTTTTAAEPEE